MTGLGLCRTVEIKCVEDNAFLGEGGDWHVLFGTTWYYYLEKTYIRAPYPLSELDATRAVTWVRVGQEICMIGDNDRRACITAFSKV